MAWWRRLPGIGRVTAVGEAGALAYRLVAEGVDDEEAVARLRAVRGGRQTLRKLAEVMAPSADRGYPSGRIYRLVQAAANDPAPASTDAEAAVEARQRELWDQPFEVSFQRLAEQVPGLRELERRVRSDPGSLVNGLTIGDTGRIGGPPPSTDRQDDQALILVTLQKAVRRLVGPRSGLSDPVLASGAAERAAWHHLREASGIDPRTWRSR